MKKYHFTYLAYLLGKKDVAFILIEAYDFHNQEVWILPIEEYYFIN